ncbi:DUF6351 family protein [Variovorax paradoxus]|jgi:hypothetical protein|uniref:DUF6351 domain-containing protein n=1 Tax=Variovorax paradoxus TaxID=34073 RepID=A0A679IX56_VARPD|nr:hypothetical protein VVAX_01390 [Variovorax paradoxus]
MTRTEKKRIRFRAAPVRVGTLLAALVLTACGGGSGGGGGIAFIPPATGGGGGTPTDPGNPSNPGNPDPGNPAPAGATLKVSVLSSPPQLVTGDDALVEVELLSDQPADSLAVSIDGRDVTKAFSRNPANGRLLGKVTGLKVGANELVAAYGGYSTRLALTAYPITGPVISGPHEEPFVCGYATFTRMGGQVLKPLDDGKCSVETRVDYYYRTTAGSNTRFVPESITAYPANMAWLTINGKQVPYVVRLESGTINRGLYQSAILHDVLNEPPPSPTTPPAGWNGTLLYPLGGGCQGGWFQQGNDFATLINPTYQSRGYAVTTSTLNVFGTNCNDQLSSETIAMVKERFIENFGVPKHTIGTGGSGGSYQSHQTSDNYPGLFDGVVVSSVFADVTSSTIFKLFDSRILNNYFSDPATAALNYTAAEKQAISGYLQIANIPNMSGQAGRLDPTVSFPAGVAPEQRYNASTNPKGARATVFDHTVNVYGKTDAEGFAMRPIDNVGIQYGLQALNDGKLGIDKFLDLNERAGGLDRDMKRTAARTVGDMDALRRAYQSGRIVSGAGGLASTAIIDLRDYNDGATGGDIHTKIHSFSMRERLRRANGHIDNHVMWTMGGGTGEAFDQMDKWLGAAEADTSQRSKAQKIAANRPTDLKDACWSNGLKYTEEQTAFGTGACNTFYPAGTTPRMAAGGPLTDDIAKCQLKPLNPSDYRVIFTPTQWARLNAAFPGGVCDWTQPGVGQQALTGTWLSFGPSPVNLLFDITKKLVSSFM